MSNTTTRRKHTEAFKRDAAYAMEHRGTKSVGALAKELAVQPSQLYVWQHQYKADAGRPVNETMSAELAALRSENRELREKCDVLKKATAFFIKDAQRSRPSAR